MKFISAFLFSILVSALTAGNARALDAKQAEHWKEDIRYYHETLLDRHIDLYHSVSEEELVQELEQLIARLPSLREPKVIFELMRITRLINDGHTQFPIMAGPHTHYPFRFRLFGQEVRVIAAAEAYQTYLRARVTAIDGKPVSEVLEILSPAVQAVENDYSLQSSLAFHLTVDNMLYAAGITQNPGSANFSFETEAGLVKTVAVASVSMNEFVQQTQRRIDRNPGFGDPVIANSEGLWLATSKETETAYLYFSDYPSFEEMLDFSQRVSERLQMEQIRNIIIDLRDNGGGDFYTGLALSQPILVTESIDWVNGVYVLIGRDTFSAAMSNAVQFRQILNARLVGEPTGANPVGYQELGSFRLPHSKRMVFYSTRRYRFQESATAGVQPDIHIELDSAAFLTGNDQALNWVRADILETRDEIAGDGK